MSEAPTPLSHGPLPQQLQAVITGITPAQVIEFTFVYGDPDLAVELVLPLPAFREFCSENACRISAPDDRLWMTAKRLLGPTAVAPFLSTGETESRS